MEPKLLLGFSAALVVGAWAICVGSYAANRGNSFNGATFVVLVVFAVAFTVAAAATQATAWRNEVGVVSAAVTSSFAAAAVLLLAFAFALSN